MRVTALCTLILLAAAWLPAAPATVLVAYESGPDAYAEALEGLDAVLGPNAYRLVDFRGGLGAADVVREMRAKDVRLIVAVGSRVLAEVQSHNPPVPVVATMVLRSGQPEVSGGRVDLDVSLAMQLGAMRSVLPKALRVGIVRNPVRSPFSAESLESRARKEGYTAVVVDCEGPAGLLKAVSALKGKVDFVLCFPDPDLYNAVTIKPLVLASLAERLPIVGFSPAFVRAGAAAGVYPDYRETGRQTAERAQRLLRGEDPGANESPRKIQIAVNQRVAHLLGIDFHIDGLPVEVLK